MTTRSSVCEVYRMDVQKKKSLRSFLVSALFLCSHVKDTITFCRVGNFAKRYRHAIGSIHGSRYGRGLRSVHWKRHCGEGATEAHAEDRPQVRFSLSLYLTLSLRSCSKRGSISDTSKYFVAVRKRCVDFCVRPA